MAVFAEQKNATQHVAAAAVTGEGTVEDLPLEGTGGGSWLFQGRSWGRQAKPLAAECWEQN